MPTSETTPEILPDADSLLEREPALVAMLDEAERKVNAVLEDMPTAFVDARRLIGRELWPLPRPEELQTIIKIAADRDAEGPRRDMPRRFLALRLVAEELTRAYWDPMLLDPGAIWCRAEDLRTVVEAIERLEDLLEPASGGAAGIAFEDRVYLKTVAHALAPRRDLIAAAITLAHPLVSIMEIAGADDVRERIPSMTKQEHDLLQRIAAIVAGEEPAGDGAPVDVDEPATSEAAETAATSETPEAAEGASDTGDAAPVDPAADAARRHIGLEVLTVRWLIHSDVAEWEEIFREAAETSADEALPDITPGDGAAAPSLDAEAAALIAEAARQIPDDPATPRDAGDEDAVWVLEEDGAESPEAVSAQDSAGGATPSATEGAPAEATAVKAPAPLSLTPEQSERRSAIHRRALEHQVLYGVVSERLQKVQDESLLMRQKETTEWLAAFRRPLVGSYSRLLTVVRNQAPGATPPEAMSVPDDEPGETFEQIFEKAVSEVDEKKAAEEAEKAAQPERRQRKARLRRIAVMIVTIMGLATVAVTVRFMIPTPPPAVLEFSPSEARNVISLSETRPIGTMLYAKLSGEWDPFSDEEKEREVVSLARIASERGFTAIYLVDDSGEPLAQWDPMHGPRLFSRPAPK